jgi:hypothetical protein
MSTTKKAFTARKKNAAPSEAPASPEITNEPLPGLSVSPEKQNKKRKTADKAADKDPNAMDVEIAESRNGSAGTAGTAEGTKTVEPEKKRARSKPIKPKYRLKDIDDYVDAFLKKTPRSDITPERLNAFLDESAAKLGYGGYADIKKRALQNPASLAFREREEIKLIRKINQAFLDIRKEFLPDESVEFADLSPEDKIQHVGSLIRTHIYGKAIGGAVSAFGSSQTSLPVILNCIGSVVADPKYDFTKASMNFYVSQMCKKTECPNAVYDAVFATMCDSFKSKYNEQELRAVIQNDV